MRAAVLEAIDQPFVVRDVPTPPLVPNGVLLRVEANGICRSDWHIWKGDWSWVGVVPQLPAVIGHEFCGVIEEVGAEVTRWKKGDRVIVPFSGGEGTCEWCRTGHHNMCDTPILPGIVGSFGMQAPHFTSMLAMVEARKLEPGKLVSRTVGLEDVTSVVQSMGSYGTTGVTVIARY